MTQAQTPAPIPQLTDDEIIAATIAERGEGAVWWVVKRCAPGTRNEQVVPETPARIQGLDFDEHAYALVAGAGDYVRRLKVSGYAKTFREERFSVASVRTNTGTVNAPTAPTARNDDAAVTQEILRELRALRAAAPAAPAVAPDPGLGVVGQVVGLITALAPVLKPAPVSPLRDYMEGLQMIEQLRGDKQAPEEKLSFTEIVQALREAAPMLREWMAARQPAPQRRPQPVPHQQLPAPQPAKPTLHDSSGALPAVGGATSGTPETPPAPEPSTAAGSPSPDSAMPAAPPLLAAAAALLLAAGQREDADPACYSGMVDDTMASLGHDTEELLKKTEPGALAEALIQLRPELGQVRPFIEAVEEELRDTYDQPQGPDYDPKPPALKKAA